MSNLEFHEGASASDSSELPPRYAEFAGRLNQCADLHPDVPELGGGRLTFVRDRLGSKGVLVSLEAVRRWFSGQAIPRRHYAGLLAEMFGVDPYWLLDGGEKTFRDTLKGRNPSAPGVVNFIAGLIQLDGGAIRFPDTDDGYIQLYAEIDGFHHAIRIVVAEEAQNGEVVFVIPTSPVKFVHIGLVKRPGMRHELYLISDAAIDAGQADGENSRVTSRDKGVRRISSFEKALES